MNHSFVLAPIFQGSLLSGRELRQIQLVRRMQRNFQVLVVFFWVAILLGSDLCGRALHFKLPQASLSLSSQHFSMPLPLSSSSTHVFHIDGWWERCVACDCFVQQSETQSAPFIPPWTLRSSFASIFSVFPPSSLIDDLFFSTLFPLLSYYILPPVLFLDVSALFKFQCLLSSLLLYNFSFVIFDKTFFFYFCSPSINFSSAPLSTLLAPLHSVSSFSVSSLLDFFLFWLNCPYPSFHVSSHPLILPILHTSFSLLLISAFLSLSFFCASPRIVFPLFLFSFSLLNLLVSHACPLSLFLLCLSLTFCLSCLHLPCFLFFLASYFFDLSSLTLEAPASSQWWPFSINKAQVGSPFTRQ